MKKLQLENSAGYDTAKGWKTRFTLDFGEDTPVTFMPTGLFVFSLLLFPITGNRSW